MKKVKSKGCECQTGTSVRVETLIGQFVVVVVPFDEKNHLDKPAEQLDELRHHVQECLLQGVESFLAKQKIGDTAAEGEGNNLQKECY